MILFFSPKDAAEAAGILRGCSARKAEGRRIAVGVLESPFKPAAWLSAAELGAVSSERAFESIGASDEALVIVSHARMDRIREISTSDLLAVVEGGVKFGAFIDSTTKAGLYFPHEPDALLRDATVAEVIMDGTIFAAEGRFGGLREYILSLEIVTPAGEIIRTGSRSVKDVTGYDIAGFVLGEGGLCGMIASVTLRLLHAPGTRLHFACHASPRELFDAAAALHRSLNPTFMEVFGDRASAILAGPLGVEALPAGGTLLVGEAQAAERDRERELLGKLRAHLSRPEAVRSLTSGELGEYRRYPLLVLDSLEKGFSLLHLAYDETGAGEPAIANLSSSTLYPTRFHFYSPYKVEAEVGPEGPLAFACSKKYDEYLMAVLGEALSSGMQVGSSPLIEAVSSRGHMEVLGWHNARLCRRRVPLSELDLPAGEAGSGKVHDDAKKQHEILRDLEGRIFRQFDPQSIMMR
jgi:hypothetical protein